MGIATAGPPLLSPPAYLIKSWAVCIPVMQKSLDLLSIEQIPTHAYPCRRTLPNFSKPKERVRTESCCQFIIFRLVRQYFFSIVTICRSPFMGAE